MATYIICAFPFQCKILLNNLFVGFIKMYYKNVAKRTKYIFQVNYLRQLYSQKCIHLDDFQHTLCYRHQLYSYHTG